MTKLISIRLLFATSPLLFSLITLTQAQTNLVINGDFEQPDIGGQCSIYVAVPAGSAFITAWNVNVPSPGTANGGCYVFSGYSDSVDLVVNPGGPYVHTGNQSVDM